MKFPSSSESILLSIYQHTICVSVCVKQALLGVCMGDYELWVGHPELWALVCVPWPWSFWTIALLLIRLAHSLGPKNPHTFGDFQFFMQIGSGVSVDTPSAFVVLSSGSQDGPGGQMAMQSRTSTSVLLLWRAAFRTLWGLLDRRSGSMLS